MSSKIISLAADFVSDKLTQHLPKNLYYHNLDHTKDVVNAVQKIAIHENCSKEEIEILLLAAWFHDVGYTETYIGHEEESVFIAENFLNEHHYPKEKIEKVTACIEATKYGHSVQNKLDTIIIDADRLSMGKDDFKIKGELLRKEWEIYFDKKYSNADWNKEQINYLQSTDFQSEFCKKNYTKQKNKHLRQFLALEIQLEKDIPFTFESTQKGKTLLYKYIFPAIKFILLGNFVAIPLSLAIFGLIDYSFYIGTIAGFIIGAVLYSGNYIYDREIIRKYSFPVSFSIGTFSLMSLFILSQFIAILLYEIFVDKIPFYLLKEAEIIQGILLFENIVFITWAALLMSLMLNFYKLSSRIIGKKLFTDYLLGKYHEPVSEERVFMFIDINSSTSLAEKMDPQLYHQMLNKFFNDIAQPIDKYEGEIFQYVGDEVVVTWKMSNLYSASASIRCYFAIRKQLQKLSQEYISRFGFMPEFKVGMHGGRVITGEVGKNKMEIAFHGDVINTTERILNQCITLQQQVLISEYLLRRLHLPASIKAEFITTKLFKGKENEVSLYTLKKK